MRTGQTILAGFFFILAIILIAITIFPVVPLFEFEISTTVLSLLSLTGTVDLYFKKACVVANVAGVAVVSQCQDGLIVLCEEQISAFHASLYSLISGGGCLIISLLCICCGPGVSACFGTFSILAVSTSLGSLLYVVYSVKCDLVLTRVSFSDLGFTPKFGVFAIGLALLSALIGTIIACYARRDSSETTAAPTVAPGVAPAINIMHNHHHHHNPNASVSHSPQHAINNIDTAAYNNADAYNAAHNYTQYQRFDATGTMMHSMS